MSDAGRPRCRHSHWPIQVEEIRHGVDLDYVAGTCLHCGAEIETMTDTVLDDKKRWSVIPGDTFYDVRRRSKP